MQTQIIFLHGGPTYNDYLESFLTSFSKNDESVFFYTQLKNPGTRIQDLLEELKSKIKVNSRAVLIGHSWGGVLALEYLRSTRDPRIVGVVLIGSYLSSSQLKHEYQKELLLRGLTQPTTTQVFLTPEEAALSENFVEKLEATFSPSVFNDLVTEYLAHYDMTDFARSLSLPLLNIFGDNDVRVPARLTRTYEQLNYNIKNLEIKGAGHFPFIRDQDRETVSRAIREFIKSLN